MKRRITSNDLIFLPEYRVEGKNGCWVWQGSTDPYGYGFFRRDGKDVRVHRVALAVRLGRELKPEEHSLHRCDNPICFNPDHLFLGSHQDNMADKVRKGRTAGLHQKIGASGVKGITWVSSRKLWRVVRTAHGKQFLHGDFALLADAIEKNSQVPW